MPASKKPASKKSAQPAATKTKKQLTPAERVRAVIVSPFVKISRRVKNLLLRRPHRSFQRTRRRDYVRSLKLPGHWAFTNYVRRTLWRHKGAFFWMAVIYGLLMLLLVGMASQDTYSQLSDLLRQTSGDVFKGNWGELGQAGLLLATGITGNFSSEISPEQQIYSVIIIIFTWLTTVWLLREFVNGRKPKLRDGLYSAGAPVLSTFLVALVGVIQLLPIAVAVIGFGALLPFGILDGGVVSMLFWTVALLLAALSLYWLTSTFIALVVVTLPGMYPMQAIRTAGDLVIGRRIRILLRMLWLLLIIALAWIVVMVPVILFDAWLKGVWTSIAWLPIVPVALLIMSVVTMVWAAGYIYLLYRRIVDDDAAPA